MCGTCDGRYARSRQGLCKIGQIFLGMIIWIVIAASPYWKPVFLLEGVTWPFHVVMLFIFLSWLTTIVFYVIFLSGYHFSFGSVNWPKVELIVNSICSIFILCAGIIESMHLWRWDYSYGSPLTYNGGMTPQRMYGGIGGRRIGAMMGGYNRGLSMHQGMRFRAYCATYPRDCQDVMSMMVGYNTYFGNHIFAVIFIWILFLVYLVSTWFAWKIFREFQQKYWKPGRQAELPSHAWIKPEESGPSLWQKTMEGIQNKFRGVEDKMQSLIKRPGERRNASKSGEETVLQEPKDVASVSNSYKFEQSKVNHRNDQIVQVNNLARNEHYEPSRSSRSSRGNRRRSRERRARSRDDLRELSEPDGEETAPSELHEPKVSMLV